MNSLAATDPEELRPLLRERIEHATGEELEAVRKALLRLEGEHAFSEMAAGAAADHLTGKHEPALVEAAIRGHRARHPYR